MGKMNINIDNDLENGFRKAIAAKFGLRQGVINKAIDEAIREWTERNKPQENN